MDVPRTLLVTNDYPPRIGGIQRTLHALMGALPPDRVHVFASAVDGAASFDAGEPYPIARSSRPFVWPTPVARRRIHDIMKESGAEVVLFGDAMPLASLGPGLARAGTPYLVAAHGFDYWLSLVPGAHAWLRRATARASRVPVMCSAFIARVGGVRRCGVRAGPAELLPGRGRVRDAVPHPAGRPRGRRLGQRLHRGRRVRTAGRRGRLRRGPRVRRRRRDRFAGRRLGRGCGGPGRRDPPRGSGPS